MQAEIITLGTELITGAAVDTNSAWLSDQLARCGVFVRRQTTAADDLAAIVTLFQEAATRCDLIIVTGGLGPTQDDLTRPARAAALGVGLGSDPESLAQIQAYFDHIGRTMTASNRTQAELPHGATALPNAWGTAPGIRAALTGATLFALPGVPREMKGMFARYIVPFIAQQAPARGISLRVVRTFGAGESNVAEQLADLMTPGRNPAVGTTASEGVISVRVVAHAASNADAAGLAQADVDTVRARLGALVYGENDATLASTVGAQLAALGKTLATAESCTGGLIARMLTDVPGSSRYFVGGLVTYGNALKTALLDVPPALIAEHGAVSEPVARDMAENARRICAADYAVSATGIAGPDGGTPDKPVGLVYLAAAGPDGTTIRECRFSTRLDRTAIRDRAAKTALNMLRHELGAVVPAVD